MEDPCHVASGLDRVRRVDEQNIAVTELSEQLEWSVLDELHAKLADPVDAVEQELARVRLDAREPHLVLQLLAVDPPRDQRREARADLDHAGWSQVTDERCQNPRIQRRILIVT